MHASCVARVAPGSSPKFCKFADTFGLSPRREPSHDFKSLAEFGATALPRGANGGGLVPGVLHGIKLKTCFLLCQTPGRDDSLSARTCRSGTGNELGRSGVRCPSAIPTFSFHRLDLFREVEAHRAPDPKMHAHALVIGRTVVNSFGRRLRRKQRTRRLGRRRNEQRR